MILKKVVLLLALLATVWSTGTAAASDAAPSLSYHLTLGPCTIGEGEAVEYTTISPQFAGMDLPEGFYPGSLTLELTGPIVVEAGGSLSIGTLSIGSTQESSPLLRGTLSQEPLIIVKAGGSLTLTTVSLDLEGEGLLILQEPGASVTLSATQIPQELAQWAPPMVNNLYNSPDDLWLEAGTPLREDLLPAQMNTQVQYQGGEEDRELSLAWDLEGYDGSATGEMTITGQFLDLEGQPLSSLRPLTLTVHWYEPDVLPVKEVLWKGEYTCSVQFVMASLPEDAQVVGEISTDNGETWTAWENFDVTKSYDGAWVCNFYEVDTTPTHYRVTARDDWAPSFWASQAYLLPQETGDDSEGNRGGSTTPTTPDREPTLPEPETTPEPENSPEPTPSPELEDTFQPAPAPLEGSIQEQPVSSPQPTPEPVTTQEPETSQTPEPSPQPQGTPGPEGDPEPETAPTTLSPLAQGLLVAGGIVLCVLVGLLLSPLGPFRKRK